MPSYLFIFSPLFWEVCELQDQKPGLVWFTYTNNLFFFFYIYIFRDNLSIVSSIFSLEHIDLPRQTTFPSDNPWLMKLKDHKGIAYHLVLFICRGCWQTACCTLCRSTRNIRNWWRACNDLLRLSCCSSILRMEEHKLESMQRL